MASQTQGQPHTMAHGRRDVAFAFDIDGVLVKGTQPLPGARDTLHMLQNGGVPFIFLTNGGGLTEAAHVARVGQRLGLQGLDSRQFIQSHTPFYDLVGEYGDQNVLVLGGHGQQIRKLAQAYGFQHVFTTSDLAATAPSIHPFPEMTAGHHAEHGTVLRLCPKNPTRIAAILVWSSPRDWCLDLQVVADLLLSEGGYLGANPSPKNGDRRLPNAGYQQDGQPGLYFCNPDLEWATSHPQPRLAQGGFCAALEGIFRKLTGGLGELQYKVCGKPTQLTYEFAERALLAWCDILDQQQQQRRQQAQPDSAEAGAAGAQESGSGRIKTVYMIGDNPASDIAGANAYSSKYGLQWRSVLVETGVYVKGTSTPHTPVHVARNVKEAVEWALSQHKQTGQPGGGEAMLAV
ncbi:hypothetical protein SLS62_004060 [Diatrype stigma]|uniref:Uncharacterized protein n=1 Tax=Diatrype stigma TaxID=117547 RepID=A0AAN9UUZ7_9PEZI